MLEKITKFVLKKWVFITLIAIEICGFIALIWARIKQNSYPYRGVFIDNNFLDALAMNKFYEAIQEGLGLFVLFFLAAIVFYTIAFVKFKRGTFLPKDRGALMGFFFFTATAIAFMIPFIYDIKSRGSERPIVKVESVIDKRIDQYKSSTDYYIVFESKKTYKVTKSTYLSYHHGQKFYVVHQGKVIIAALPMNSYVPKIPIKEVINGSVLKIYGKNEVTFKPLESESEE